MSRLVDDLLDLAHGGAAGVVLHPAPFAPRDLANAVASVLGMWCRERGLRFRLDLGPDLPGTLIGDKDKIRRVLLLLGRNAVDFTPRGEVRLRIAWRDGRLEGQVQDTGLGVAPEEQRGIFELFSKVDTSFTREHQGPGLGLAIVRQLLTAMGGEVELDSTPGQGSTFSLSLELPVHEAAPPEPMETHQRVVIVADDNATLRSVMGRLLGSMGHRAVLAQDGAEAAELFASERPDVVFMDLEMEPVDGFEGARRIRQLEGGAHTPIYALTGSMGGDAEQRARAAGMTALVTKPVDPEELRRLVAGATHPQHHRGVSTADRLVGEDQDTGQHVEDADHVGDRHEA